jgi:hypothetical protein
LTDDKANHFSADKLLDDIDTTTAKNQQEKEDHKGEKKGEKKKKKRKKKNLPNSSIKHKRL